MAQGVLRYLAAYDPSEGEARAPVGRTLLRPAREGAPLYARPDQQSTVDG